MFRRRKEKATPVILRHPAYRFVVLWLMFECRELGCSMCIFTAWREHVAGGGARLGRSEDPCGSGAVRRCPGKQEEGREMLPTNTTQL